MTNTNLIPFSFEGKSVRVIKQGDAPHWVLTDVCTVLEIGNSRKAASRLDDDEKGVTISDTLGGPQEMTTIKMSLACGHSFSPAGSQRRSGSKSG